MDSSAESFTCTAALPRAEYAFKYVSLVLDEAQIRGKGPQGGPRDLSVPSGHRSSTSEGIDNDIKHY